MPDKSTPDQIARKTVDASIDALATPPCECCKPFSGGASWVVDGCDCGNTGDLAAAQAWCTRENMVDRVVRLIIRFNERHDELVKPAKALWNAIDKEYDVDDGIANFSGDVTLAWEELGRLLKKVDTAQ